MSVVMIGDDRQYLGGIPVKHDELEAKVMTSIDEFRAAVIHHFGRSRKLVWTLIVAGLVLFAGPWGQT
jgi:hypothetical protein